MSDISKYQTNLLKPQNFSMEFNRAPNCVFHCRQVPLPNMSIGQITNGTGQEVNYKVPASIEMYDPMTLMFAVDEDLNNYNEIFDWMEQIRDEDYDYERHTSDASVILHTNKNNPNKEYVYIDCWPMTLSEITFNGNDEMPELLCTAIFSYDKLVRNKNKNPL